MHMLARRNGLRGKADDLVVAANGLARSDVARGHLMPWGHQAFDLEAAVKQRLGATGQLSVVGDRANVALKETPADALAQWLADAREKAQSRPRLVQLQKQDAADTPPQGAATDPTWRGTLVLQLP